MGKITIQEIANKLTVQNGLTKKEATLFVNMMFETIREALERDKNVKVKGLGTFKIIDVESRESVNVNTGERVLIEGHNKITFTPDAFMKELVNKPFSQFETVVLNDGVDFKESEKEVDKEEQIEAEEGDHEIDEIPLVDFASADAQENKLEEIADEDIPEWVIEPYVTHASPKPIDLGIPAEPETPVEPVAPVESEILAEPDVKKEPETSAESEPVIESEPVVEPEPAVEPEVSVEDEPDIESLADLEDEEDEPASKRWMLWLMACLLALGLGYLLGNYFPFRSQKASQETVKPQIEEVSPVPPVAEPVEEMPEIEDVSEADEPVEQAEPKTPEVKAPAEVKTPEVKLDKYEAKDPRVKNGAYRIVGTDHVEKVKEGDNLQRICKRTIGPGMECYIEVFNDIDATTELKKGMEIKIPKVELKKKKKAQN